MNPKIRSFYADAVAYRRCPHFRLYPALKAHFPSVVRYYWTDDQWSQTHAVDLVLVLASGMRLRIELKQPTTVARRISRQRIPLELWSAKESRAPGFLLKNGMECDFVLWVFADGTSLKARYSTLSKVFKSKRPNWCDEFGVRGQKSRGRRGNVYRSEFVPVPLTELKRVMPFDRDLALAA